MPVVLPRIAAAMLLSPALPAAARSSPEPLQTGAVVESVTCRVDPSQSYALFLPPSYSRERAWPILYLLDARARGALAASRFEEGARRLGYIVASSNNSMSDGPVEPNLKALRAMWVDTQERFSVDLKRVHVGGFSGGARVAWMSADALGDEVAGVIGAGAGFPDGMPPTARTRFSYFGLVGNRDFNYYEMKALADTLESLGLPHRVEIFDGPHEWPPPELCAQALEWMDLQAMKKGRRDRDETFIDALLRRESERDLAAAPPSERRRLLKAVLHDFEGVRDVSAPKAELDRLESSPQLRADLEREAARDRRDREYLTRAAQSLAATGPGGDYVAPAKLIADLRIQELKRRAERSVDREESLSAQRLLESVFVQTAFYVPRALMERKEYARAALSLQVALSVHPDRWMVWLHLARAQARAGRTHDALQALRRAIDNGLQDRSRIESDPDLVSLRGNTEYRKLIEGLAVSEHR